MNKKLYTTDEIRKSIKDFEKTYKEYAEVADNPPAIKSKKNLIDAINWLEDLLKVLKK